MPKPKIEEFEPYVCNECQHAWDKKAHAKKQCPSCGSVSVEPTGQPAYRLQDGEKVTVAKDDGKGRPPQAQMDRAMAQTGKEKYVKTEDLHFLEKDFSELLTDLGVGLPNMMTEMIFNGDIEDPVEINKKLTRYHVKPWKRQMIIDVWCQDKGIATVEIALSEQEKAQGMTESNDMDDGMDRMIKKMERMATMKMMMGMVAPQQVQPQYQQPPPQQQQMVPMLDKDGMNTFDSEGNPVMVPAWQFQMMEQRRLASKREADALKQAAKPSEMESALALAKEFMEMAGSKGDPDMMIKLNELTSRTQMQELKGGFDTQLGQLQANIDKTTAIEEVEARYNSLIGNMQKQQEQLTRELEDQRRERIRSIEDAQVRMQSDINTTITDAAKEGLGEFRATRRDMKDIAKEQMRTQQLTGQQGPYPPGTQPGYSPVQELTAAQLEADFAGMAQQPGQPIYGDALDDGVTIPEDGDEFRHY